MQLAVAIVCLLLAACGAANAATAQDAKCGSINEEQLLKQNTFAVPTEHQWLARITYANGHETKLPNDGCLGALVSKRNVIAPAHCFVQYDGRADAYSVQLGVWNKSSNAHEVSCDKDGYCVLPAQDIPLAEIAVHPEYDPLTLKHSLAVLTLQRDAKLTPNVLPVCMPPPALANATLVGQLFVVAGLPIKSVLKHKTWVNTISRPYCQKEHSALVASSSAVCGYQDRLETYYLGAPLVGIQVSAADVPQNFYLVGLLLDSRRVDKKERIVASFLDIRPYLSFIQRNAEFLIVKD
ncbi:CG31199 [Drosophila busckii]|uniref:CG31199 n=1 Tax=Drosophila busckii TaxID=30019 RepID=A0A0M3QXX9_DROBS|nr:phenoloxidase-activating factor 3 [Drosophila busckii]ALC46703.1 CG31199 [Drosophila busckii]